MIRGLFDKSSLDSVAPATLPVLKGPGAVAHPLAQVDLVMHSPDLGRQIARVAESDRLALLLVRCLVSEQTKMGIDETNHPLQERPSGSPPTLERQGYISWFCVLMDATDLLKIDVDSNRGLPHGFPWLPHRQREVSYHPLPESQCTARSITAFFMYLAKLLSLCTKALGVPHSGS